MTIHPLVTSLADQSAMSIKGCLDTIGVDTTDPDIIKAVAFGMTLTANAAARSIADGINPAASLLLSIAISESLLEGVK